MQFAICEQLWQLRFVNIHHRYPHLHFRAQRGRRATYLITATKCFSGTRRGWGFRVLSCAAKAAFVSRRGEGARMGGGDAPPSARRLVLRSASREGGSLKPGGGKSPPYRQRRSFVAPGFVVARSAAFSTKKFEEPFLLAACFPLSFT